MPRSPSPHLLRSLALAILLASAWAPSGCLQGGGSDTETVEPMAGVLMDPSGTPVAGAEVRLVPAEYDPTRPDSGAIRVAITDAAGRYRFEPAAPGRYNLVAQGDGLAAFAPDLAGDSVPGIATLVKARTFYITLHGSAYQAADSGRAWFPGTDILVRCDGITATRADAIPKDLERLMLESRAGWKHDYRLTTTSDTVRIRATRDQVIVTPP